MSFTPIPWICTDCNIAGVRQAPCRHQQAGHDVNGHRVTSASPLTGPESALSSLPSCPIRVDSRGGQAGEQTFLCGEPARHHEGRDMRCTAGHVFSDTPAEHEQARGALAAEKEGKVS